MSFNISDEGRARMTASLKRMGASDAFIEGFTRPPQTFEEMLKEALEADRRLQVLQVNLKRQLSQDRLNPPPGPYSPEAPQLTPPETNFEVHGHQKDQACPAQRTPECSSASPDGISCPACGRSFQCSPTELESQKSSPGSDLEAAVDHPSADHATLIKGTSSTEGGAA